jgi:hypothetical protein
MFGATYCNDSRCPTSLLCSLFRGWTSDAVSKVRSHACPRKSNGWPRTWCLSYKFQFLAVAVNSYGEVSLQGIGASPWCVPHICSTCALTPIIMKRHIHSITKRFRVSTSPGRYPRNPPLALPNSQHGRSEWYTGAMKNAYCCKAGKKGARTSCKRKGKEKRGGCGE